LRRVPITYVLDRDAHLVHATVRGDFTVDEMLSSVTGAATAAGEAGYNVVSDHREIGEPITRVQLEQLVDHLAALRSYFAGARWAVVVSKPASFGMMRMFEVLAERVPMTVRVFVDADRAQRWARGASDPDLADGDALPTPPRG
jgi:hypothetical protein